jgi:hypothetical protein
LEADRPKRKRINASDRRQQKAAALELFIKQTGRKAQKGVEPNDRRYDRKTVDAVRHMSPEELDRLLRDGDDE